MDQLPSLTRVEAEERAALVEVHRYDIDVDLMDLLEGSDFRAVCTVHFSCRTPGASTFVDAALDVVSATLNGETISADRISTGRIQLTGLAADNVLVVESVQAETAAGEWVHRSVDPSDKEVYVWTSFEPDDARRAWACFDQPDLKAPHAFTVLAPAAWMVVSNSPDPVVTRHDGGGRQWKFPDTPPLSTYVPVITAGPFHEIRSERGGYDLGLLSRRSLARFLDRDAEELFEVTAQGLACFGDRFGLPFPQRKYDQVFLPDMGGAMENYGCVTWSDTFVYRSAPTYTEQEQRAQRAAARDGAHVVRRHGDHALVGRPLAQRGLRRLGLLLGRRGGHPVPRRLVGLPRQRQAARVRRRHGSHHPPDPAARGRRRRRRRQLRRRSPIPRAPACSSSCSPSSARTRASPGCGDTSPSTPGETPGWST